jgi:uncharacterized protein (TIGR01777 family)
VAKILITGASGLIGKHLTELLEKNGHEVSHLGRKKQPGRSSYTWDIAKGRIDDGALDGKDVIIHLAGAAVADKRWTDARKKEIIESRTESTKLLINELQRRKHHVKTIVAASAIGYYGFKNSDHVYQETDPAGDDFLATVVKLWEVEEDKISDLGIRLVKIRIGIVLTTKGGALKEMMKPVKLYAGAPLGTGRQFLSWIHIDDICGMFLKAVEDQSMYGPYNGVAPRPVDNREITSLIARSMKKPLILPSVPGFVLKLLLGEMADLVLQGSKVSSARIQSTGFKFLYPDCKEAVNDLVTNQR